MKECYLCHQKGIELYHCQLNGCKNWVCYTHSRVWDRAGKGRLVYCLGDWGMQVNKYKKVKDGKTQKSV